MDKESKNKLYKLFGGIIGGLLIIFIIFFIISSCSNRKTTYSYDKLKSQMVTIAQNYYEKEGLPENDGDSSKYTLEKMIENGELEAVSEMFDEETTCDGYVTVTNNNGYYLYIPVLNCKNGDDEYTTQTLASKIIADNLVETSNGLYKVNDEYIFKGDTVNNYLSFNDKTYLITRINKDGSIRVIELIKEKEEIQSKWDNRYNIESSRSSGINEYIRNNINSIIKDKLDSVYESLDESVKPYIVSQTICIAGRSSSDTTKNGETECSETLANQYITLLNAYEYLNASLDENCISTLSSSCKNYNYFGNMSSSLIDTWLLTPYIANRDDAHDEAYLLTSYLSHDTCNSSNTINPVYNLDGKIIYLSGDGSSSNPYTFTSTNKK